eukprot:m.236885 g.236885  ORF g.236885 m.236885 type:complete len:90 (+) comp19358_c0_seq1:1346-1615(+)
MKKSAPDFLPFLSLSTFKRLPIVYKSHEECKADLLNSVEKAQQEAAALHKVGKSASRAQVVLFHAAGCTDVQINSGDRANLIDFTNFPL